MVAAAVASRSVRVDRVCGRMANPSVGKRGFTTSKNVVPKGIDCSVEVRRREDRLAVANQGGQGSNADSADSGVDERGVMIVICWPLSPARLVGQQTGSQRQSHSTVGNW